MKLQHPAGWSEPEEGSSQREGVCFSSDDHFGSIAVVHVLCTCRREWLVLVSAVEKVRTVKFCTTIVLVIRPGSPRQK